MANDCYFDIDFRGKRGNVMLLCDSVATYHGTELLYAAGTDELYEAHIQGVCAWSVNYCVTDEWYGAEVAQDLNKLSAIELRKLAQQCTGYSLCAKSRVLQCDVMAHYWSEESGFDHFEYYCKGNCIKKRKIAYDSSNLFDWETMEFIGHEGEYDESEHSEATALLYALMYSGYQQINIPTNEPIHADTASLEDKRAPNTFIASDGTEYTISIDTPDDNETAPPLEITDKAILNDAVDLTIPDGITCIKKTIDGKCSFHFSLNQQQADSSDDTDLTFSFSVQEDDETPESSSRSGIGLINHLIKCTHITNYIKIYGECPALVLVKKVPIYIGKKKISKAFIIGSYIPFSKGKYASLCASNLGFIDKYEKSLPIFSMLLQLLKGISVHGQELSLDDLTAEEMANKLKPTFTGREKGGLFIEVKLDEKKISPPQSPSIIGKEDSSLSFNHSLDNIANSNAHGPIIDSIRADRQLYLERQENEAQLRQEWEKKYSSYISEHPSIIVSEKKFVFVGYSAFNEKEDPFVKRVVENGGLYRSKVSGVTDYLVIGNGLPGESKIKAAIEQQKAGKPIQIIRQQALEDFLDGKAPSDDDDDADETPFTDDVVADETPLADDDAALDTDDTPLTAEDIASISPEARKEILNALEQARSAAAQTRENAQRYADVKSMQEKMQQEKEQNLQEARENARIDPETDEACMFITLSNIAALSMEQEYQTAEDFFESFGEDYPAYDQAALWQLRNQVQEKMKNAVNRQTYIHRFMQLPVEDRFSWTTRSCFDIAYIFDVGEKYEKAISIGQKWITSTEMPEFQRLCQQDMDEMRESLRSQFAALCEDWLYWPRAKALLYVEYRDAPSPYDDTTLSCTVDGKVVTLCLRSSGTAFAELATQVLNYYAWFWSVPIKEIWLTAYKNRFDANGRPLQDQYVENVDDRSDNTSLYLCQALDSLDIDYSSAPSSSIGMQNSGTASYRMSAVPDEAPAPVRKKEGCYIATAVYGSYDAPQVLTLRRFRDQQLKKTALGRLFIRVYYRLSPPAAARLRNARHVNRLVRRCLDRWVQHLEQRQ